MRFSQLVVTSAITVLSGLIPVSVNAAAYKTVPPPPAATASRSAWERWAAQQRESVESTDWKRVLHRPGCEILEVKIIPGSAKVIKGAPPDLRIYGVSVVGYCQPSVYSDVPRKASGR